MNIEEEIKQIAYDFTTSKGNCKKLENRILSLFGVVSTFFCEDEDLEYSSEKCKEQCSGCKWIENL